MYTIRFPRGEHLGIHLTQSHINHRIFVKHIEKILPDGRPNPVYGRILPLDEIIKINHKPIPANHSLGHIIAYFKFPSDCTLIPITFQNNTDLSLLDAITNT